MNKESDLRKCPECEKMTGRLMHVDVFPCKCGDKLEVEYTVCDCGLSWRSIDGAFIDGCNISVDNIGELLDEVEEFFEDQDIFEGEDVGDSMEDLIHKCIKCDEIATQSRPGLYECTACEFSWEVDKFNE